MKRIKNVKDLQRLPSGNFLNVKTRIVYEKAAIEQAFAEELAEIEDAAKPKAKTDVKPEAKKKHTNSRGKK